MTPKKGKKTQSRRILCTEHALNSWGDSNRLFICLSALFSESQNSGGTDSSPDPLVATALQLIQLTYNICCHFLAELMKD